MSFRDSYTCMYNQSTYMYVHMYIYVHKYVQTSRYFLFVSLHIACLYFCKLFLYLVLVHISSACFQISCLFLCSLDIFYPFHLSFSVLCFIVGWIFLLQGSFLYPLHLPLCQQQSALLVATLLSYPSACLLGCSSTRLLAWLLHLQWVTTTRPLHSWGSSS